MSKKFLITIVPIIFLITGCQLQNAELKLKTYNSERYGITLQYSFKWNIYEYSGLSGVTVTPKSKKFLMKKPGGASLNITGIGSKITSGEETKALRDFADKY